MKVTAWSQVEVARNIPAEYRADLPKTLFPVKCSFEINHPMCNNAVANAIRRVIGSELPVKALVCTNDDIKTNDEFVIPEMLASRLIMIPLAQSCPLDTIFELDVTNNEPVPVDVLTGQFTSKLRKLPFNENMPFMTLNPGKTITIKNIKVVRDFGYIEGKSCHVVAVHCVALVLDVAPLNTYEDTGKPSRETDGHHWQIKFRTNGTMDPKDIIREACDNIIARAKAVDAMVDETIVDGKQYRLTVMNETHTIGNLFMKTICDLFPQISYINYNRHQTLPAIQINCETDDDFKSVIKTAADHIEKIFGRLRDSI